MPHDCGPIFSAVGPGLPGHDVARRTALSRLTVVSLGRCGAATASRDFGRETRPYGTVWVPDSLGLTWPDNGKQYVQM